MSLPLPRVTHPSFELVLPSSGKKYNYRPMVTGERKVLLIALESNDTLEISRAVTKVINACVDGLDAEELAVFDVEWVFLQLVINSIKDVLELQVSIPDRENECVHCGRSRHIRVSLRDAKVDGVRRDKKDFLIQLDGGIGIKLRYPTDKNLQEFDTTSSAKSEVEQEIDLVSLCVDCVFDESTTYPFKDYSYQERVAFIESLPGQVYDKIEDFVRNIPRMVLEVPIKCTACNHEVKYSLRGLKDFLL